MQAWNKGLKGIYSDETRKKISETLMSKFASGELNASGETNGFFGKKHNAETREKWKASRVGQSFSDSKFTKTLGSKMQQRIHTWVRKNFGVPDHCDLCGLSEQKKTKDGRNYFDWSNRTGIYEKSGYHWWMLCKKCHKNYDLTFLCVAQTN